MPLIQAGPNRNLNIPDAVVDAVNARLISPEVAKCRLYKDGNTLMLKARGSASGLILILR